MLRGTNTSWQTGSMLLAGIGGASDVWLAFWLDDGNSDVGRIDNISVSADVSAVPLPAALPLFLSGPGLLGVSRRFC